MNIFDVFPEISQNRIFKDADKNLVEKYLDSNSLSVVNYCPSDVIFSPQSDDDRVAVIVRGRAEIISSLHHPKLLIKTVGKGAMFGISNLYAPDELFPTSIVAKSECKVLFIEAKAFSTLLESDIGMMKNFLRVLSEKILYLNKKIISYTIGSTEQKLAYFLCENEIDGELGVNMSISDIAVMLNMGRASLYRALEKLEADGIISKSGRKIKIIDKSKLKTIYISN